MQKNLARKLKILFCLSCFFLLFGLLTEVDKAQQVVDKTVASVSDGASKPELITYSDLLWQLALEPNTPLVPPTSEDLNRALQTLINLRLFALEAQRLPSAEPKQEEIDEQIRRIVANFKSEAEFQSRLRLVGFDSIKDDNFQKMMRQRAAIEKYIEFRFRSFVIITLEEERKYYNDVYTPDFRRKNPGLLLPTFETVRTQINQILTERKIEEDILKFLDAAKNRAEIIPLSDV
ncbi:MAG TPA: hypothetical protein PKY82_08695 [Pyrinomonadaceae bacterium]|nr:hypothetical protein [Pyrinomonadaceae bacterium]